MQISVDISPLRRAVVIAAIGHVAPEEITRSTQEWSKRTSGATARSSVRCCAGILAPDAKLFRGLREARKWLDEPPRVGPKSRAQKIAGFPGAAVRSAKGQGV